jgi:hypothetical protein
MPSFSGADKGDEEADKRPWHDTTEWCSIHRMGSTESKCMICFKGQ